MAPPLKHHTLKYQCTVISLIVHENAAGEVSALTLARWFDRTCQALLVEPPLDEMNHLGERQQYTHRRTKLMAEHAREAGLDIDIQPLSFEEALSNLPFTEPEQIMVLAQPAHPLERQSPAFRKLSAATSQSPSAVIYAPHELFGQTGDILAVAAHEHDLAWKFARKLTASDLPGTIYRSSAKTLGDIRDELMARPAAARYSLLVLTRSSLTDIPGVLMSLAALSGTPILVLEPENSITAEVRPP